MSWAVFWCRARSACGSAIRKVPRAWRSWLASSRCSVTSSCMRERCSSASGGRSTETPATKPPPTASSTVWRLFSSSNNTQQSHLLLQWFKLIIKNHILSVARNNLRVANSWYCCLHCTIFISDCADGFTAGVTANTADARLDLLLRVWGGSKAEGGRVWMFVFWRDRCVTWCKHWCAMCCWCRLCPCVNTACLLADDSCGDHRERQRRREKVWDLVQWQGGSIRDSGEEHNSFRLSQISESFTFL